MTKVMIEVREEIYDRLELDRKDFQETIGGGEWTIEDTLTEYFKILNTLKKK